MGLGSKGQKGTGSRIRIRNTSTDPVPFINRLNNLNLDFKGMSHTISLVINHVINQLPFVDGGCGCDQVHYCQGGGRCHHQGCTEGMSKETWALRLESIPGLEV
jgi:hypothetical protein